ncbi:MAG: DUF2147 domain-containing protein [Bacteroidales bacterium]|nr:DUF2147 domain-containing protein [Bacteroidales bacterium]
MNKKFFSILGILLFGVLFSASAQIVGNWKTIDDETGKAKSVVEIYEGKDGKFYGKITKLFREPGEEQNPICDVCPGSKKDKPVIGMIIISGMEKTSSNMWKRGTILDPATGNVYDCKMWRDGKNLEVRGYLGISLVGRSQTWLPY